MTAVARWDRAVILARGDSARMGGPKGLCRLPGEADPFLVCIARLHAARGVPVAVLTRPDLLEIYRAGAGDAPVADWLVHPRGGGTATTVLAAVAALDGRATHLWLHPVDLPLVASATLERIAALSAAAPGEILVPRYRGLRGHPVLTPLAPWRGLDPVDHPGPMRDLLAGGEAPLRFVDVPDPGICRDFDAPADLAFPPFPRDDVTGN